MSEVKAKKALYKRWWVWVIAAIVLIAIVSPKEEAVKEESVPTSAETTTQKAEKPEAPTKVEKPAEPKKAEKEKNKPEMSKSEFDTIKTGMTYEEAVKIIGSEGEVLSESGEAGTDLHTVMYMWDGEGSMGANANILFQGGKVNTKAQFGLE